MSDGPIKRSWSGLFGSGEIEFPPLPTWATTTTARPSDIENWVNTTLLKNGWDYDERKRVLFMLRNHNPQSKGERGR